MRATVIGAGRMGTGIAQVCAEAGVQVSLLARRAPALEAALASIQVNQRELVGAGLLTAAAASATRARIHPTIHPELALAHAEFVLEAIVEDLGEKQACFRELERLAPETAILATSTSSLSITAIASATRHPERAVGLQWLDPPHLTLPVEITRGRDTSDGTLVAVSDLVRRLGRVPIRVEHDVPGFLWRRLELALVREACHLVEQGVARREDVDLALQWGLGPRWAAAGPFRLMDLGGLEDTRAAGTTVYPELSTATVPGALLEERLAAGATGAAAGRGMYDYPPGAHAALLAARNARLIALRRALGPPPTGRDAL